MSIQHHTFAAPLPYTLHTSFVGREEEFGQATGVIRLDGARLVTLTGPGGVGKTRLAVRIADALARVFRDGTVFVPLAPIRDAELVLPAIGATLGIRDTADQTGLESLASALQERGLLLVLDNFEQVIAAGEQVAELIARCPSLSVLVTSRTALQVYGERLFPVSPLKLPDRRSDAGVAESAESAAVRLFVDRAQAVDPGFALTAANVDAVVEICRRLDGLPLAIELAAARIAHLAPAALLERLNPSLPMLTGGARDLPERLRTVRSAIEWSYDLLGPQEQRLFRRLGVFSGGFTLEAVEAVASEDSLQALDVLDGIAALVAQSLVRLNQTPGAEPRYAMLETIREFAAERLAASADAHVARSAHAYWFAAFCERAQRGFASSELDGWLGRTEKEQPNIRAALAWSLEGSDPDSGIRICRALGRFWWARGDPWEGKRWLDLALRRTPPEQETARAWLQVQLGEILWSLAEYDEAVDLDNAALAVFQRADDRPGMASCLLMLGIIDADLANFPESRAYYERSLALYREIDDPYNVASCLANLGLNYMYEGDLDRAAALQKEALALAQRFGGKQRTAAVAFNLAEVERLRGRFDEALALYEESFRIHEALRERRFVAETLRGLARIAAAIGELDIAAMLAGAEEVARESIGARITPAERIEYERALAEVQKTMGSERFPEAMNRGRAYQCGDSATIIEAISRLQERLRTHRELRTATPGGLSSRELEVLALLTQGMSDREIGDALFISHRTVNGHVARVFEKLGVNTRTEAAVEAVRLGVV